MADGCVQRTFAVASLVVRFSCSLGHGALCRPLMATAEDDVVVVFAWSRHVPSVHVLDDLLVKDESSLGA